MFSSVPGGRGTFAVAVPPPGMANMLRVKRVLGGAVRSTFVECTEVGGCGTY